MPLICYIYVALYTAFRPALERLDTKPDVKDWEHFVRAWAEAWAAEVTNVYCEAQNIVLLPVFLEHNNQRNQFHQTSSF